MKFSIISICSLIYLIFTATYIKSHGFFDFSGAISLLVIFAVSLLLLSSRGKIPKGRKPEEVLTFLLISSVLLSLMFYGGLYQRGELVIISHLILALDLFLAFLLFFKKNFQTRILFYLGVSAVILRVLMLVSSPEPKIDAYYQLKEGAVGLVHGQNPYKMIYTRLYSWHETDYFTYLPAILFLTLPSTLFFADPRISMLLFELVAAYIFYLYLGKDLKAKLMSLIFLFSPLSLYVLEESYGDIIIAGLFIIFLYFYHKKNYSLSGIILGLIMSTKLMMLIIFPLLFAGEKLKTRTAAIAGAVFTVVVLPFVLWSPYDFFKDTFLIYQETKNVFLPISLGLPALLGRFGIELSSYISLALFALVYLYLLLMMRKNSSLPFFAVYLCLFALSLFSWQAFVNNYYLIGSLLLLSLGIFLTAE